MSELIALALGTLLSEDLACIAAGVLVAQGRVEFVPAVAACLAGIFAGDLSLYLAGRFGWAMGRKVLGLPAFDRASEWLRRRQVWAVILSRFTPGLRVPTYVAAGFLRVPSGRFALTLALAAAVWTPLVVGLAAWLRERVQAYAPIPVIAVLGFVAVSGARKLWRYEDRRALVGRVQRAVRWEFWPSWLAYLPLLPYLGYLAVKHRSLTAFCSANPGMPRGGLKGESKIDILRQLASVEEAVPRSALLPAGLTVDQRMEVAGRWELPLVLKPDVGERGQAVAVIRTREELRAYLQDHAESTIVQEYVPGVEAGVFYIRYPDQARGQVVSITEKLFPKLAGDGRSTVEELILRDGRAVCVADHYLRVNRDRAFSVPEAGEEVQLVEIGSHCRGAIFRDGSRLKSARLEEAIDRLAKAHPGFYLGRFDVRAESLEAMREGRFKVIELNGVSSEPTHIYDPAVNVWEAYRALGRQWKAAFEIGVKNRAEGAPPVGVIEILKRL